MNAPLDRTNAATDDDPRLLDAAKEYLAAIESGRRPDGDTRAGSARPPSGRAAPTAHTSR